MIIFAVHKNSFLLKVTKNAPLWTPQDALKRKNNKKTLKNRAKQKTESSSHSGLQTALAAECRPYGGLVKRHILRKA